MRLPSLIVKLFGFCLLFLFSYQIAAKAQELPAANKNYIFISIPKSGSHLMTKLLTMLSNNNLIEIIHLFHEDGAVFPPHHYVTYKNLLKLIPNNSSLWSHFNFLDLLQQFSVNHPEYVKFMMVRDLRDVCVSTTFFIDKFLIQILGPEASFDDKLMYVIKGKGLLLQNSVFNVQKEAECALQWMLDPSVFVCRFEELCGEKGGGNRAIQEQKITEIASVLEIALSQEQLEGIIENLWGESKTFRKGQIGSWKTYFKEHHIQAFKDTMGIHLILLGYEKDMNW